jgi:hypothetical protein
MDDEAILGRINNLDRRLLDVGQILPTLATKDDVKAFATKDDLTVFATKQDLKAFATKQDLKAFATKQDLKAFATKEDLKAYATKEDLKSLETTLRGEIRETRRHMHVVGESLRGDIQLIAENLAALMSRRQT